MTGNFRRIRLLPALLIVLGALVLSSAAVGALVNARGDSIIEEAQTAGGGLDTNGRGELLSTSTTAIGGHGTDAAGNQLFAGPNLEPFFPPPPTDVEDWRALDLE